jgi:phosphoesterase RecJ-like protein
MDYNFIKTLLSTQKKIVITTHKTPDGDALGSSLAMFHALKDIHKVSVIVPNEYPYYLKWMPSNEDVVIYEGNEVICNNIISNADIIFCLDFNKAYRVESMSNILVNNSAYKIMIDHHEDPDDFCDQILSNSSISSTAELVYEFLSNLDFKLNKEIAIGLYTGIITDTGSLRYPNVTKQTHIIVSKLMEFEINHSLIHENLFDSQTPSRLELLKICLNNLTIYNHQKTALIYLTEKELISSKYQKGDTEGFVNIPLGLDNICFSVFFIEFKDGIKISFRSQGSFDVNKFAKTHFNGGGHKNAAGGILFNKSMVDAIDYFSDTIKQYTNDLK